MVRTVMQPVSGTFELRWQWHRGDARPPEPGPSRKAPDTASRGAAVALRPAPRPRLDEVKPTP